MAGQFIASIGVFKTMLDIAKGLKDITGTAARHTAVIELQEKILAAQASQSTLIERIGELEKEVVDLKAWKREKKRYELREVAPRVFAYVVKPSMQRGQPSHWICANCYQKGQKFILQGFESAMMGWIHTCHSCNSKIETGSTVPLT